MTAMPEENSRPDVDASQLDDVVEDQQLTIEEISDLDEPESELEPVSYSGIDYDVEGLVRRLQRDEIKIPNFGHGDESLELLGFQRGFVWRRPQMDRFIESLLLGFPIPGIMLVQQLDKRYLVLDGQQRLRTLQAFYEGTHAGKVFSLENVALEFKGLTYKTLSPQQRRTIDNTFIQATIVRTDGSRESLESVYQVFERLNSGGTQLTAHEIRIALYPGPMIDFLAELNSDDNWRAIYGASSPRLRDQELILRILALFFRENEYSTPLKGFLNDFVNEHRDLTKLDTDRVRTRFRDAGSILAPAGARSTARRAGQRINAAMLEAIYVGAMRRLEAGDSLSEERTRSALAELAENTAMVEAASGSTANEEKVRRRLQLASQALSDR
jgi:hypothetical protein